MSFSALFSSNEKYNLLPSLDSLRLMATPHISNLSLQIYRVNKYYKNRILIDKNRYS